MDYNTFILQWRVWSCEQASPAWFDWNGTLVSIP